MEKVRLFSTTPRTLTFAASRFCFIRRAVSRRVVSASTTMTTPSVQLLSRIEALSRSRGDEWMTTYLNWPRSCVNHADGSIASSSQDHSRADTNRSTPRITLHCGKQVDLG